MYITINMHNNEKISYQLCAAQTLAQAIWLADAIVEKLTLPALCSGIGLCGQCRVRFLSEAPIIVQSEKKYFSQAELEAGWRLSCLHQISEFHNDIEIELSSKVNYQNIINKCTNNNYTQSECGENHTLAVDLGTSSIYWQVQDYQGNIKASGSHINPQMGAGSEIMSRLLYAKTEQGAALLAKRISKYLQKLMQDLNFNINEICIAANSAMTYIFLQKNLSTLSNAPYSLTYLGNEIENISGLPPIYIPALLAPFVGADLSAGIVYIQEKLKPEYPYILVDLGTNGELVLALDPKHSIITSVPLGPSLEGIGLSCGCMAQVGSVAKFSLVQAGLLPFVLQNTSEKNALANNLNNITPLPCKEYNNIKGMCATAYFSLIHILLQINIIARDGTFCKNPINPLGKLLSRNLKNIKGQLCLSLPLDLYLSASDVEEILKVKAAFSVALISLLNKAGLQLTDIKSFFLAGALGQHIDSADFEALGFLPYGFAKRLHIIGNSSLQGAALLLNQKSLRQKLQLWSNGCELLELTADDKFTQQYLSYMNFN